MAFSYDVQKILLEMAQSSCLQKLKELQSPGSDISTCRVDSLLQKTTFSMQNLLLCDSKCVHLRYEAPLNQHTILSSIMYYRLRFIIYLVCRASSRDRNHDITISCTSDYSIQCQCSFSGVHKQILLQLLQEIGGSLTESGISTYISLPNALTSNALTPNLKSQPRITLLLVDDDVIIQKVFKKFGDKLGCTVSVAENGMIALSMCKKTRFDIIFMDIQMPLLDGYTTTQRIREYEAQMNLPKVPIIGRSGQTDPNKAIKCGMTDYVHKDSDLSKLEAIIKQHCRL